MSDVTDDNWSTEDQIGLQNELGIDEIEAAYMRAMQATESLLPEVSTGPQHEQPAEELSDVDNSFDIDSPPPSDDSKTENGDEHQVTSTEVLEALLFVGGSPIPSKKICEVIGGSTTQGQVDSLIEELNSTYQSQNRPYEVRLIEGGYRMALKPEFESIRRRVYGQGPKDVKLNQDSLEVLAFIAYQQPAERERLDELGKKNVGGTLRQLLRRQLIQLERGDDSKLEAYRTTKRFLELFGLSSIDDLPQAVDFNFK